MKKKRKIKKKQKKKQVLIKVLDFYPVIILTQFGKVGGRRKTNTYTLECDK